VQPSQHLSLPRLILKKTYLSKVFCLYAVLEWGLKEYDILCPHSFRGVGKNGMVSFMVTCQNHEDFKVTIPEFDQDFLIIWILNKSGDNCVVVDRKDCISGEISFKDLASIIKVKFRAEPPV
jgi:hypothetical protein